MNQNPSSFTPTPYEPSAPASFTPTQGNYKNLQPFRYWCQKVLPLVYDDSLSYYELLCKVVDYLNKTMEDVETLHDDVDNLHDSYVELQNDYNAKYAGMTEWINQSYQDLVTFVNTYFANLDVQEEINTKLDAMALDGSLSALIEPFLPDLVDAWLAEHITNPSNPPLDTSLTLANAAAPAKTVGDKLADIIANESTLLTPFIETWRLGISIDATGAETSISTYATTYPIQVNGVGAITRKTPATDSSNNELIIRVSEYSNESGLDSSFIHRTQLALGDTVVLNSSTKSIKISIGRVAGSGINMTQSDINTYFRENFYRNMSPDVYTMRARGNIISLGKTSLNDCTDVGFYTFTTSDLQNLSNLPDDITSGGLLITYYDANSRTYWQQIITPYYNYTRYSLSGVWGIIGGNKLFNEALKSRGNVVALGYSSLAQCTKAGFYVFGTSDIANISDMPSGITTGGLLITYHSTQNNVTWQEVKNADYSYMRYGTLNWYLTGGNKLATTVDKCFQNRGGIITQGYNTCANCSDVGYYTFNTANSAVIPDLPKNFNSGGILFTFYDEINNRYWQLVKSNIKAFIRYGLNGVWSDERDFIRATYIDTSGDDNSTERINIDLPNNDCYIRYALGHCVDVSINADVWRLMYIAFVSQGGTQYKLTRRGEFECAVHLANRPDFSGGVVHGDEVESALTILADGKEVTPSQISGYYQNIKIIRTSNLYDPSDNTTVIAKHSVEYIFNKTEVTINQSLDWLIDDTLTSCYLAMLPVLKDYSLKRYDDTDYEVKTNPTSDYSVTILNAKSVTEFGGNRSITLEIPRYPTGLQGGDCALITDNQGINYNKIYFVVCTGGSISSGDKWLSTSKYSVNALN